SCTPSEARRRVSAEPTIPRCPATKTFLPFRSNGIFSIGNLTPGDLDIAGYHLPHEVGKTGLWLPAEFLPRLAGIADQQIDLGGAEILGIDANHGVPDFVSMPVSS